MSQMIPNQIPRSLNTVRVSLNSVLTHPDCFEYVSTCIYLLAFQSKFLNPPEQKTLSLLSERTEIYHCGETEM